MGCTRTVFPGGMGFACTRGQRETCNSCRGTSVALCDWPLAGEKTGQTCDRRMCKDHRTSVGPNVDYCPSHAALHTNATAIIGGRTFRALHLVREVTLALPGGIVSGHAIGPDIVGEITGRQMGRHVASFPVRVPKDAARAEFTKAAFARNTVVADVAREADAFVNADSRGTWDTIQKLRSLGKVVRIHEEPPAAEHALLFHTGVHPSSFQSPRGYKGPSMLDISGNAGSPFAPSKALLSEARRMIDDIGREAAFEWYRPRYIEEQRTGWRLHRAAWDAALARTHFVASCYCSERQTCHRSLFAELLVKAGAKVGRRVVDGGEVIC